MLETKGSECDSSITLPSEVINSKIVGGLCRGLEYEEKRRIRQEKTPTAIQCLSGRMRAHTDRSLLCRSDFIMEDKLKNAENRVLE